jgi:hypothetical protein
MTSPTATIKNPDSRDQLFDAFMTMAKRSFELCEQARANVVFYKTVLRKLDDGESIEAEVPEVKGMMADAVRLTVQRLLKLNQVRADEAWELADNYKSCFHTTVRSVLPEAELIPQYDVEYVGQVEVGDTKILVKTFRRNIQVKVHGSDEALDQLWIQVSFAAMMKST